MGFFTSLKNMFNKNVECGDDILDCMIVAHKKKTLHLNKNIYIRENNACVIVYRGKVTDVLFNGKFRINGESIPETYNRAKIEKLTKNGAKINKIKKVHIYFVNLSEFKLFNFLSDVPFKTKSNSIGKVKGCISGTCCVKVLDASAIIKYLLNKFGKIKTKKVHEQVGCLIGNKLNSTISKQKILVDSLFGSVEYVEGVLNNVMQEALDREGLFVSHVKLKAIDFVKKHQLKVNSMLSERSANINGVNINTSIGTPKPVEQKVPVTTMNAKSVLSNTMQIKQKTAKVDRFKVCDICGKKNTTDAKICIGCGKVFK